MFNGHPWCVVSACLVTAISTAAAAENSFTFTQRLRAERDGRYEIATRQQTWDAKKTAVIVCDMWDVHHCLNATRRGAELAPRMNAVLKEARSRGATIIHAPSDIVDYYKDHPARKRAIEAPAASNLPKDIASWCSRIPSEEKGIYPIDQSDGGEDDDPAEHAAWAEKLKAMGRNPRAPWAKQTELLDIDEQRDLISASGVEIWNVLEHRGIENVILLGVHTNMCVLGRPFGLRQMARNGKNVVLMRDMTDTMYNPQRWPYVSHFRGTDLIVQHIEKFVCPTVTSDQVIGGEPFRFKGDVRPTVVVVLAESEYETDKTVPPFVEAVVKDELGLDAMVLHADSGDGNKVPGLVEAMGKADLLFLCMRRRALPEGDLAAVRKYLDAGKPLIALRTSSHAFDTKGKRPDGHAEWPEFDAAVLGGNYTGHHGHGPVTAVTAAEGASGHVILGGVDVSKLEGRGSLYKAGPLKGGASALLMGSIPGQPAEPVAWTNTYKGGRIFYTSFGHKDDFANRQFVALLTNAVRWAMDLKPLADKPQ